MAEDRERYGIAAPFEDKDALRRCGFPHSGGGPPFQQSNPPGVPIAAQQRYQRAIEDYARSLHDMDNATIALFKHLKPSDIDECLSREAFISPMQYATRNLVFRNCLSAADNRNQGR